MKSAHRVRKRKQTRNVLILVAAIAAVAAVVIAVIHFQNVAPPPASTPTPGEHVAPGGKVWGRAGAPVTIEVYSDFL